MKRGTGRAAGAAAVWAVMVVGLAGACSTDEQGVGRSSAAIEVGPEVEVEPVTPALAAGSQYRLPPLRAGGHYLVAWRDQREDWPGPELVTGDLFAARVTDVAGGVIEDDGVQPGDAVEVAGSSQLPACD